MNLPLLIIIALLSASLASGQAAPKPNFLWLIAEDFGPHLGCYGTTEVSTPVLDALAAKGMRFTRFYTTAPVCSASRSAFMTGMYQTTIGAQNHRSHRSDGFPLPANVRVLTDWLRDEHYFTANVVKLPDSLEFKGSGKTDWNFTAPAQPFDTNDWTELKAHQPFYAQINFQETHRTYHAPQHADPDKVVVPPYYPDHPITRTDWAEYLDAATELDRKVGKIIELLTRDGLAENTVLVFFGDNGQSHVRGKQFCYEEGLNVPLIVLWPSGLPQPQGYTQGTVSERLIASIDLTATTLALASGKPAPAAMEGQPFLGEHAGKSREYVFGARDRCDETVFRLRTVRDARYRYIRNFTPERPFLQANNYKEKQYPVWSLIQELHAAGKLTPEQDVLAQPTMPPEELYDMQADPHELQNLIASDKAEHTTAHARLKAALEKWIADTHDQGATFETPEVIAAQSKAKPGKKKGK